MTRAHDDIERAMPLTKAQAAAVEWLREHGGDGIFDNNGVLLAAGESAPFMRSTWSALRGFGLVEFYKPTRKGRGRCRLTEKAEGIAL